MNSGLSKLTFPLLCVRGELIRVRTSLDALTTTTKAGLKNGYFRGLVLVDSRGQAVPIKDAHKLRGVGLFWGYNVFLNQRIKVELELSGEPFTVSLNEVKEMVRKSFQRWHGWSTRDDFEELKAAVESARSISEIIERLS
jgi:hypothetical protein